MTPTPTIAEALEFANEIKNVADCYVDRCLIALAEHARELERELTEAKANRDWAEANVDTTATIENAALRALQSKEALRLDELQAMQKAQAKLRAENAALRAAFDLACARVADGPQTYEDAATAETWATRFIDAARAALEGGAK